jgi:hypothetical protein
MPIHDWTRVPSGLFHHFHQDWTIEIARALNRDLLPDGHSARVEQRSGPRESDVLTVEERGSKGRLPAHPGDVLTLGRPVTRMVYRTGRQIFASRANRILVKHHPGRTVSVIEVVSPGNKDSKLALDSLVAKTLSFLKKGIHVLIVDLFPPTPRDPLGIHKRIWDEFADEPFEFPSGKDRLVISIEADEEKVAYVEPVGVGDVLPNAALFLAPGVHIKVPLEPTYQATWNACSKALREAVETGILPEADEEE